MTKKIYVAATNQHIGKTTSTLGLVKSLSNQGLNVGYCKPVGQEFVDLGELQVDKDALLFSKMMGFDLKSHVHSPVILGKGATSKYLDNPQGYDYSSKIRKAALVLEKESDIVIYEGTGHPGVGSVVNLSNATVAKMLGASVVMIVKGGIGNTIDRLQLSLCMFKQQNVPIKGVIINKVIPEKIDKITHYVGGWLKKEGIELLGVLPYDASLSLPIIHTIKKAVYGKIIKNKGAFTNKVEGLIPGSLITTHNFQKEKNQLLVVSDNRLAKSIQILKGICEKMGIKESPLAGIILTGDGQHSEDRFKDPLAIEYVDQHQIPVISTPLDTYGSVVKINNIEVKINIHTPWKVRRAIQMVEDSVNLKAIHELIVS